MRARHRPVSLPHGRGFGLVELLVGMLVGLITVVVIMQVLAVSEGYKRTATTGSDSQTNGIVALRSLEAEIRMAGYGITNSGTFMCPSINKYYNGTVTLNTNLMPVKITDGGTGGASDSIEILYSSSGGGAAPLTITTDMPIPANVTRVNTVGDLKECDFFLYACANGNRPCTLGQVTDNNLTSTDTQFHTGSGTSNYNPPGGFNDDLFPSSTNGGYASPGYSTTSCSPSSPVVVAVGNWITRRYAVSKTASKDEYFMRRTNLNSADDGCSANSTEPDLDLVSNIVNIQAQYGVAPANSQTVDCWTNAGSANTGCSITSGNNWSAPPVADIKRIKAIRIAIVVRSALAERPATAGGSCDTTAAAPTSWNGGPAIDLSSVPNWQCFRYKVYQTVVPLINVLWANT